MKLLVGIMYCIENEIEQCINSINQQSYKDYDYFIIENLPNKQAHEKLYSSFMQNAHAYDIFIKVDADMVLSRDTFFQEVIDVFSKDPELDDLEIGVQDFYTDQLIFGLHVYSNRVTWDISDKNAFVDMGAKVNKHRYDMRELAPAAYHCPNPSKLQSFHFGIHKAIKIMQLNESKFSYMAGCYHWMNIVKTKRQFDRTNNNQILYALAGAILAFKNKFGSKVSDFNNSLFISSFKSFDKLNENQVLTLYRKNIRLYGGFIDSMFVFEFLIYKLNQGYSFSDVLRNILGRRYWKTKSRIMKKEKSI